MARQVSHNVHHDTTPSPQDIHTITNILGHVTAILTQQCARVEGLCCQRLWCRVFLRASDPTMTVPAQATLHTRMRESGQMRSTLDPSTQLQQFFIHFPGLCPFISGWILRYFNPDTAVNFKRLRTAYNNYV